jgi:hypothetical protein
VLDVVADPKVYSFHFTKSSGSSRAALTDSRFGSDSLELITNLAKRLKGQPPAVVAAAISDAGHDRAAVAADYVRQFSDADLAMLDPALLHQLPA